jgi:hypothetical protein
MQNMTITITDDIKVEATGMKHSIASDLLPRVPQAASRRCFKAIAFVALVALLLPAGLAAQGPTQSPPRNEGSTVSPAGNSTGKQAPKNAVNLYLTAATLVATAVQLSNASKNGPTPLMLGAGYERVINDRFSLYGSGLFYLTLNPLSLVMFDASLTGRYYVNGTPLKGFYTGLALGYDRLEVPPFLLIDAFVIKGLVGYKFMFGPFYLELEGGGGLGIGRFNLNFLDVIVLSESAAGCVPSLAINAGLTC